MANGIFFNKNLTPNQQFLSVLKDSYDSEVKNMQFGGTSHELVNKWIEEKTNGCIKDMLDKIDELTVCLIINAIYFKAKWKKQFKANDTMNREFNCVASEGANPEKKEVRMMNFFDGVPLAYHTDNDGNLFFMMPYECDKGKNVSMIVMLPNESNESSMNGSFKLDNKEQSLTDLLNLYSDHSKFRELMLVKLSFPKFKYKYKINLNEILKNMGQGRIFDTEFEDFSPILAEGCEQHINVSDVFQQAFVAVDEEGTEAAAATVVQMMLKMAMMPRPTYEIKVDRPFAFWIVEHSNQDDWVTLFSGKVLDPTKE